MKKLIIILLLPCSVYSQSTAIPDSNFEQALIDLGLDDILDGSVQTSNIDTVQRLDLWYSSINDLTGIEDFVSLTYLDCTVNNLTSLDLSQNTLLDSLDAHLNELTSISILNNSQLKYLSLTSNNLNTIDVSNNTLLSSLNLGQNNIAFIDLSQNILLEFLWLQDNNITSLNLNQNNLLLYLSVESNPLSSLDVSVCPLIGGLDFGGTTISAIDLSANDSLSTVYCYQSSIENLDLSNCPNLAIISCFQTPISCLNLKNGNTNNLWQIHTYDCPNLWCIEVDDPSFCYANWDTLTPWINYNSWNAFSNYCDNACSVGIMEIDGNSKELIKVTDLMGRETEDKPNTTLIYIYSDGTTEKVYRME